MWPFSPKKPPQPSLAAESVEDLSVALSDLNQPSLVAEANWKKSLQWQAFQAFESNDDTGNFFGLEFEIRATAARIKALYAREPWIYASATKVARALSNVSFKVYKVGASEPQPDTHPLHRLINGGGPLQDARSLRWAGALDLFLGGHCFIVTDEQYRTLIHIPLENVTQIVWKKGTEIGLDYIVVTNQNEPGSKSQGRIIKGEYVVQWKMPNPYNPFVGMSPFMAAARPILLDRYKSEFEMAFYLRGAANTGVIETTEDISQPRMARLLKTFESAFTGKRNWWRTLFLPKGAKWVNAGLSMADMQHLEGMKENRKAILAVIGVPPSAVGLTEDVNKATSEQQERELYENTIKPLAELIAAGWNTSTVFSQKYKGQFEAKPDFSGVSAVEGSLLTKGEQAKAVESYFLIDEIREELFGKEALPDGKGQRFVAEVRGSSSSDPFSGLPFSLSMAQTKRMVLDEIIKAEGEAEVYALLAEKSSFDETKAKAWGREHGFKAEEMGEEVDHWRLEQRPVSDFIEESLRTIPLAKGILATVGQLKPLAISGDPTLALPEPSPLPDDFSSMKAAATSSQNRIEDRLSKQYRRALDAYVELLVKQGVDALESKKDLTSFLANRKAERTRFYWSEAEAPLTKALDRGFSSANANAKMLQLDIRTKRSRFTPFSEVDQEAIDLLKERTEDEQRASLAARGIERFEGFDEVQTERMMQIIEDGFSRGDSFEKIARELREEMMGEAYQNQARTIVRTEILSAVSAGLHWNNDVLGQVFSEVRKQWLHQGDAGTNPDAREDHADFEGQKDVPQDYKWSAGGRAGLGYPRDPSGEGSDIINCRCSMISVIPDSATSNAPQIIEG